PEIYVHTYSLIGFLRISRKNTETKIAAFRLYFRGRSVHMHVQVICPNVYKSPVHQINVGAALYLKSVSPQSLCVSGLLPVEEARAKNRIIVIIGACPRKSVTSEGKWHNLAFNIPLRRQGLKAP